MLISSKKFRDVESAANFLISEHIFRGLRFGRPVHHDRVPLENRRTRRGCIAYTATRQQARHPQISRVTAKQFGRKMGCFLQTFFSRADISAKGARGEVATGTQAVSESQLSTLKVSSGSSIFFTKMRADVQRNG